MLDFAATDPEYSKIFSGGDKPLSAEVRQMIQGFITETVITNANAAVDATSIVFAQSILDDCAWSYLKVCAMVCPDDWESLIDAKKVDLRTMREQKYEAIRAELIEAKLNQLERESLITKIDLLFSLCRPPTDYAPIGHYQYDRERLLRIDKDRHGIIHQSAFNTALPNVEDDLLYISKTAWFIMGLVNQRYGLRIDMRRFMKLQTPTPEEQPEELILGKPVISTL